MLFFFEYYFLHPSLVSDLLPFVLKEIILFGNNFCTFKTNLLQVSMTFRYAPFKPGHTFEVKCCRSLDLQQWKYLKLLKITQFKSIKQSINVMFCLSAIMIHIKALNAFWIHVKRPNKIIRKPLTSFLFQTSNWPADKFVVKHKVNYCI